MTCEFLNDIYYFSTNQNLLLRIYVILQAFLQNRIKYKRFLWIYFEKIFRNSGLDTIKIGVNILISNGIDVLVCKTEVYIYKCNRMGSRIFPCGTPDATVSKKYTHYLKYSRKLPYFIQIK